MSNLSKDQELTIKTFPLSIAEAGQVTLPQEVLDSLQVSPENSLLFFFFFFFFAANWGVGFTCS